MLSMAWKTKMLLLFQRRKPQRVSAVLWGLTDVHNLFWGTECAGRMKPPKYCWGIPVYVLGIEDCNKSGREITSVIIILYCLGAAISLQIKFFYFIIFLDNKTIQLHERQARKSFLIIIQLLILQDYEFNARKSRNDRNAISLIIIVKSHREQFNFPPVTINMEQ